MYKYICINNICDHTCYKLLSWDFSISRNFVEISFEFDEIIELHNRIAKIVIKDIKIVWQSKFVNINMQQIILYVNICKNIKDIKYDDMYKEFYEMNR